MRSRGNKHAMWINELPKLLAQYEKIQGQLLELGPINGGKGDPLREELASNLKLLEIRIKVSESQRAIWAFYIAAMGFGLNIAVRVAELVLRGLGHL